MATNALSHHPHAPPATELGGGPAAPRRVVIADSEAAVRADLAQLLTGEGFAVVGQAADGDQAVALATDLRPDLVLINTDLPDRNGTTTATAALTTGRIAPVLILTTSEQPATFLERARHAGAMTTVRQPFTRANLLPAIEMSIARHADTAALRDRLADITDRLAARKVIDRATGTLMANRGITTPEAFRWLQSTAMDHQTSILQVATAIIDQHRPADAGPRTVAAPGAAGGAGGDPSLRPESTRHRPSSPRPTAAVMVPARRPRPGGAS